MVQMALQEVMYNGIKSVNAQMNTIDDALSICEKNSVASETDGTNQDEPNEEEESKSDDVFQLLNNVQCLELEGSDKYDVLHLLDESTDVFSSSLLCDENATSNNHEKDEVLNVVSQTVELDMHDCLQHPSHLVVSNKLEASKNTICNLEGTIHRLEKQLGNEKNQAEKISQLEQNIVQYEKEIQLCKQEHELDQRTVTSLKKEMDLKLASMKKQYETANKEKENMVMRYAVSEKELLDCKKEKDNIEKKLKEINKENESSINKIKTITSDKNKLSQQLENKASELSNAYKEIDKLKEEINSRDIKIKWTQSKLKSEMDMNKEFTNVIEGLNSKIQMLNGEIGSCYKEVVDLNSQLAESRTLECNLKDQLSKLILEKQRDSTMVKENHLTSQQNVPVEVPHLVMDSQLKQDSKVESHDSLVKKSLLDQLKESRLILSEIVDFRIANEKLISDITSCQDNIANLVTLAPSSPNNKCLDNNSTALEQKTEPDKEQGENLCLTKNLKIRIEDLESQLAAEEHNKEKNKKSLERAEEIFMELNTLRNTNEELMSDIAICKAKEAELLAFTQKLTTKNVELQSEFSAVESKANELELTEKNHAATECHLKNEIEKLQRNLDEEKERRQEETRLLARQVAEKTAKAEGLLENVNTLQSELSLVKNKHTVQIKELQRELSQYRRKLDQLESATCNVGSTATSLTSGSKSTTSSQSSLNDSPISQGIDVPAQVLVERIVKLQQESAKQNDRIEFLEEHTAQLVKELQKKSRLLQNYILREQTGTLTSNSMDRSKAELSKSGGIMASLYSSKPADETMTFELCLEINRKLQAVLEDTLLKNITLKENIDTLGDEIARLSQKKS